MYVGWCHDTIYDKSSLGSDNLVCIAADGISVSVSLGGVDGGANT